MLLQERPVGQPRERQTMPPSKDVVKIAVQMMGAIPQLIELNQVEILYIFSF